ncbi:hypothetical protein T492DRAFT_968883 [Pavlovales sp. CCMP2436]|nr:hypothetical protein T492DRAFT_968883 [Pavlovales sp. CCMP2436]
MRPTPRARAAQCGGCVERRGAAGEGVFQLDANAGLAAALAEALLQSHSAECAVHLLPALPSPAREPAWRHGTAHGLRARGGLSVGLDWRDGALTRAAVQRFAGAGEAAVRVCIAGGGRLRATCDGTEWPVAYEERATVMRVPRGAIVELWPMSEVLPESPAG